MARFEDYEEPPRALEGLKVVELPCLDTMPFMAASMAAKSFADFGAEVVKVEPPRTGSQERALGPFRDEMPDPETGGLHLFLNTNKLGVTIDLENPRGRDQVLDLLASADIVFNPNRPEVNEKLGIDWRTLTARFPKLIVVSITFFGAESAYRNLRGGDLVATHMSGVGYETPWHQVTDPESQPPLKLGGRQSDYLTGYTAAAAAMCALYSRKSNGAGQHVDVAQWFSMVSMVRPNIGFYSHEDKNSDSFQRLYSRQKRAAQWVYPCKDGWVSFNAGTDRFWRGAKNALGRPEWMDIELFDTVLGRASNIDAIEAGVIDWLSTTTRTEAFKRSAGRARAMLPGAFAGRSRGQRAIQGAQIFRRSRSSGGARSADAGCAVQILAHAVANRARRAATRRAQRKNTPESFRRKTATEYARQESPEKTSRWKEFASPISAGSLRSRTRPRGWALWEPT